MTVLITERDDGWYYEIFLSIDPTDWCEQCGPFPESGITFTSAQVALWKLMGGKSGLKS